MEVNIELFFTARCHYQRSIWFFWTSWTCCIVQLLLNTDGSHMCGDTPKSSVSRQCSLPYSALQKPWRRQQLMNSSTGWHGLVGKICRKPWFPPVSTAGIGESNPRENIGSYDLSHRQTCRNRFSCAWHVMKIFRCSFRWATLGSVQRANHRQWASHKERKQQSSSLNKPWFLESKAPKRPKNHRTATALGVAMDGTWPPLRGITILQRIWEPEFLAHNIIELQQKTYLRLVPHIYPQWFNDL